MSQELQTLVKEFFELIDGVESTDDGKYFFPLEFRMTSVRVMKALRVNKIMEEMREVVQASPRMTEKEMFQHNNPDGCAECLGTGRVGPNTCKACEGSGSSDPSVCKTCMGTGDLNNHERDTAECFDCGGKGYYEEK